jgi:hypothetical protein
MASKVAIEVNALKQMTVLELRAKHAELFGEETPCRHKDHLWKRIAWRLQAVAEGDLSDRARQRAVELADDADLRLRAPSRVILEAAPDYTVIGHMRRPKGSGIPMPGTELTRTYKGQLISVMVRDDGFQYDGQLYRSLSAIAQVVTGSHWNGYHFFGIKKGEGRG